MKRFRIAPSLLLLTVLVMGMGFPQSVADRTSSSPAAHSSFFSCSGRSGQGNEKTQPVLKEQTPTAKARPTPAPKGLNRQLGGAGQLRLILD